MSRLILVAPLLSLAVVGCADRPSDRTETTQLGARIVPLEGVRTTAPAPSWDEVRRQLDALPIPAGVFGFRPTEGMYTIDSPVIHVDECGADTSAFPPIDHEIEDVHVTKDKVLGYFTNYIDAGVPFQQSGCQLDGHVYRCAGSFTSIDFGQFGLDAIVFVENGDFGAWSGQTDAFIGLNPYTVRCEGTECGVEPAASLFGLITQPMPCTGIDGHNLILQQ